MIGFAELKIELDEDGNITLTQPFYPDGDQIIAFPPHQAEAICAALLQIAKSKK